MQRHRILYTALLAALLVGAAAFAQTGLTVPPSGDNQKSTVIQHIGPVEVSIGYSSPDITSPRGEDRRGMIWGQLVAWGFTPNPGFGNCQQCPWRAGANENTVFTVSHDVEIEGKPLPAGTYGLHMAPGEDKWTIIFSKNSSSWGSYFYNPEEDVLRIEVTPEEAPYRHWLTYDFFDRQPNQASVRLWWDELAVPFTISVPDIDELYFQINQAELRGGAGFIWQNWARAARELLQSGIHPDIALEWAEMAINAPFAGDKNFNTLSILAQAQEANGKTDEALATAKEALEHASNPREKGMAEGMIKKLEGGEG